MTPSSGKMRKKVKNTILCKNVGEGQWEVSSPGFDAPDG